MDAKSIIERSERLFGKKSTLLRFWQEVAEHFYPERADFTATRYLGEDFAANLTSSYPIMVRRELGNAIASMLRPRTQEWFQISIDRPERLDKAGRVWLERQTSAMRREMYAKTSGFVRATKEGDHDFATFGQTVIYAAIDWKSNSLLYQTFHLRDVAWCEDAYGRVDTIYRRWKAPLYVAARYFGKEKMAPQTEHERDQWAEYEFLHCVMPGSEYSDAVKRPWMSIWVDVKNKHVIEAVPIYTRGYIVPRFQTVSGSQYAFSPATVAGLPDARLLQAMTLTLLEAGEMAVRPPMVATKDAIRGGVELFAGGITWVDRDYDERAGEAMRPLTQDKTGLPFGLEMTRDTREMLAQAFFLNKLALPETGKEMTAYEANQRMQEYVRGALPLFEPAEAEYNGSLCEETFELAMRAGKFGPASEIPRSIRGTETRFQFESPLHDALERQKGLRFSEARELILAASEIDQSAAMVLDARIALREALAAIGTPTHWTRDEREVEEMAQAEAEAKEANQAMQEAAMGGAAAEQMGKGAMAMAEAEAA